MATFRIHQDQENRGHNVRQTQKELPQQQKRAVLGVLNNHATRIAPHQSKQVRWGFKFYVGVFEQMIVRFCELKEHGCFF
jgi:hypothetical protein